MTQTRTGDDQPGTETPEPTGARRRWRPSAGLVSGLSLTAGAVLVVVLLGQNLEVYFTIGPYGNVATPAQGTRYEVTAVLCGALLLVGTVAAIGTGRLGRATFALVLLVVGVVVAFLFAVPSDRWDRVEPVREPGTGSGACYSGGDSDECVGG